jgi:cytochrome P450
MQTQDEPVRLDPDFLQDPHAFYERLRTQAPVRKVTMPGGLSAWLPGGMSAWLVTSYAEARALLADPRLCKNNDRMAELASTRQTSSGSSMFSSALQAHLLNLDPPDHSRLRGLVNKAFTAGTVARLRPRVEEIVAERLAEMATAGTIDLLEAFAHPVPITVICELLGVPAADRDNFRMWANTIVSTASADQLDEHSTALARYLAEQIAAKRSEPTADLLSDLVHVRDEGDRLSEVELLSMGFLLLVAGLETTANLIANGVLALLERPDQLDRLRADPALIPGAIEEFLRFQGPVNLATLRFTAEPVRVGEIEIPANEPVMISLLAANRDGERFPDPGELDISRPAGGHLAFGHGIHYCLGAPLARLQAEIALRALLARFGRLELACEPGALSWRDSALTRGLAKLPVRVG